VDLCPKPNVTIHELSKKSHVEDLDDKIPTLFQALTDQDDTQGRWSVVTFPVDIDMTSFMPVDKVPNVAVVDTVSTEILDTVEELLDTGHKVTVNCSVAYMSQCMSWNKCKTSCRSMGASSYRWFHDGCCQCVGSQCINYGINQSRCEDCPLLDEDDEEEISDEEMEILVNMEYDDEDTIVNEVVVDKEKI